jgi:hypothetical protein
VAELTASLLLLGGLPPPYLLLTSSSPAYRVSFVDEYCNTIMYRPHATHTRHAPRTLVAGASLAGWGMRTRVARSPGPFSLIFSPPTRSRATSAGLWAAAGCGDTPPTAPITLIAWHARVALPIARDSRYRSPDAHLFRPRRARSRARCARASLPASGAATPARPPSCHGRARGCRSIAWERVQGGVSLPKSLSKPL